MGTEHRTSTVTALGAAILALVLLAAACGSGDAPEASPGAGGAAKPPPPKAAPAAPAAEVAAQAEQIFATRCMTCHGPKGAGDGPASAGLSPKPRNFQDPAWQKSVTDEHIEKIILYGGAAVGRSAAMPGNPDLIAKKPVVTALREHVRGLAP